MHFQALRGFRTPVIMALLLGMATGANATITISSNPTKNVTCSGGVCTSTPNNGVLNVSDLQNLLASGNVKVMTTGSGHQAGDVKITAALSWVSSNTLTLDSYHSVIVNKPVSVSGSGGLTLVTNDGGTGGTFSFGPKGYVTFWSLSSNLTINGAAYTLVGDIATLSSDILANASGHYALAANYDASKDGAYGQSLIGNTFTGTLEGLGNTISNLSINESLKGQYVGLFREIDSPGVVENLTLANAQIVAGINVDVGALVGRSYGLLSGISVSGSIVSGNASSAGALAGESDGNIVSSHATATVRGCCRAGGLVGGNAGEIQNSYATGAVFHGESGGLVGDNAGSIVDSYATGPVKGQESGGLAGSNEGPIRNSYATGKVTGGNGATVGGLVGTNRGLPLDAISASYSIGHVSSGSGSIVGGFVGEDDGTSGSITNSYWDTTTSGIGNSSQGAGNVSNDPGITGLTTVQLQAGLPTGFDSSIWAESATINSGLPYLLDIPPP